MPRERKPREPRPSRATPRQNRADDVVEHEGGFCRRTHVTSDSFSTPASRRGAFIPTSRATPPFASLDRHSARAGIGRKRDTRVGERPATRGFYGNGSGVARDNLVIGIPDAGWQAGGRRRIFADLWKREEGEREINARRLVYRQQSRAKSRGAHPREHCLFMRGCPSSLRERGRQRGRGRTS